MNSARSHELVCPHGFHTSAFPVIKDEEEGASGFSDDTEGNDGAMHIALNTNNATDLDLFSVAETILLHKHVVQYDMYVCMYVICTCLCVCITGMYMYVCVHVCMYVCMYACIYVHKCMYVCGMCSGAMFMCIHTCTTHCAICYRKHLKQLVLLLLKYYISAQ